MDSFLHFHQHYQATLVLVKGANFCVKVHPSLTRTSHIFRLIDFAAEFRHFARWFDQAFMGRVLDARIRFPPMLGCSQHSTSSQRCWLELKSGLCAVSTHVRKGPSANCSLLSKISLCAVALRLMNYSLYWN